MHLTFWRQYNVSVLEWVFASILVALAAIAWPLFGWLVFTLVVATIGSVGASIISLPESQSWVLNRGIEDGIVRWAPVVCALLYTAGVYRVASGVFGSGGIFDLAQRRRAVVREEKT